MAPLPGYYLAEAAHSAHYPDASSVEVQGLGSGPKRTSPWGQNGNLPLDMMDGGRACSHS